MKYRLLNKKENDQVIIEIMEVLLDPSLPFSGAHRRQQWEKGWGENLKAGDHIPRYFGKHKVNRINQKFIKTACHWRRISNRHIPHPVSKSGLVRVQ